MKDYQQSQVNFELAIARQRAQKALNEPDKAHSSAWILEYIHLLIEVGQTGEARYWENKYDKLFSA